MSTQEYNNIRDEINEHISSISEFIDSNNDFMAKQNTLLATILNSVNKLIQLKKDLQDKIKKLEQNSGNVNNNTSIDKQIYLDAIKVINSKLKGIEQRINSQSTDGYQSLKGSLEETINKISKIIDNSNDNESSGFLNLFPTKLKTEGGYTYKSKSMSRKRRTARRTSNKTRSYKSRRNSKR